MTQQTPNEIAASGRLEGRSIANSMAILFLAKQLAESGALNLSGYISGLKVAEAGLLKDGLPVGAQVLNSMAESLSELK